MTIGAQSRTESRETTTGVFSADALIMGLTLSNAPVEERIEGWNVGRMQYTEVEYVAVKTKYFIMSYNSGFCLVDVQVAAVYFSNTPSQLF